MQKIKILLCGALGAMGQNVIQCANAQDKFEISCGFDLKECEYFGIKIHSDLESVTEDVDVVIDFSHCSVTDKITEWCVNNKKPLVCAVTGLSAESEAKIRRDVFKSHSGVQKRKFFLRSKCFEKTHRAGRRAFGRRL